VIGEGADAPASVSGGTTKYVADISVSLIGRMEDAGLAIQSTTRMGSVVGTELQFQPQATEFIFQFFHPAP
jgi:hypothetical protein